MLWENSLLEGGGGGDEESLEEWVGQRADRHAGRNNGKQAGSQAGKKASRQADMLAGWRRKSNEMNKREGQSASEKIKCGHL